MKSSITIVFISFLIEAFVDISTSLPTLSKFEDETKSVNISNQTELPSLYPDYADFVQYTELDPDNAIQYADLDLDNALQYTDLDPVQYADIDPDEFEHEVAELLPEDYEMESEQYPRDDDRYRRRSDDQQRYRRRSDDDRYYRRRYYRRGYRRGDWYRYHRRTYGRRILD
ncbi:7682_t:CDS:2 [Ambispora gerdemannii]|uniref:7682_t:CDS:1 n=1 Tax=Ambispora gerdemannii TaxID=144530 RepID=A0A9N8V852_9GLOM|nr:7682_t:CDS:2 [Ambispora gerdemannii]